MREQTSPDQLAAATAGRSKMSYVLGTGAAVALAIAAFGVTPADAQQQQAPRVNTADDSDYHVIRDGDTIWDLSQFYYGDPYEWPRMWGYNSHITNPHWVYPGDIVYLADVDEQEVQDEEEDSADGGISQRRMFGDQEVGLYLAQGGMILTEEPTPIGRIIGSPKGGRLLVEQDDIWLGFGDKAYTESEREETADDQRLQVDDVDAQEGDRFAIIRQDGQLTNSDGETIGMKYYVLGSAVITEVPDDEDVARTARVDQSWREMERGDLVVPYERQRRLVQPRQAEDDVVATVVDSLDDGAVFGPQQYIFVDRGAEDGVRPGNRFFIYQQWEGFEDPREQSDPEIPWQQVGQVMLIDVREEYSMAVITRSDREIYVGDRLEMYQGY